MVDNVILHLKSLKNIIFRQNEGNLGDCIIAYAQNHMLNSARINYQQLLSSNSLELKSYDNYIVCSKYLLQPFDFVYGGGGLWTQHYNYSKILKMYMYHRNMRTCTILPSSFTKCDDAIESFDERFTIFCRDWQSYNYCTSKNKTAKFILHDDIAFWLKGKLPNDRLSEDIIENKKLKRSFNNVQKFLDSCQSYDEVNFIRSDAEKTNYYANNNVFDISHVFGINGLNITQQTAKHGTMLMMYAIQPFKKIITNRLHVAITAALMGKTVEMHDNNYGKLSAVWKMSMQNFTNIQFK